MGISTSAQIAFGVDYQNELPKVLNDIMYDEDYEELYDSEEVFLKLVGYDVDNMEWKEKHEKYKEIPIEIIYHCSEEYPMCILAIKGTRKTAYRGEPKKLDIRKFLVISQKENEALAFCEKYGIEDWNPEWLLFSYWSI